MAKLIQISGDSRDEFTLVAQNTIGRHPSSVIQIRDGNMSKRHAEICRVDGGKYLLRDLGSLNGTFVANKRVTEQVLEDGDEVTLGTSQFIFENKVEQVEKPQDLTFISNHIDSHIRDRIAAEVKKQFPPEKEVQNEEIIREDYEKLRVAHILGQTISSELDEERLLPKILEQSFEILSAERGVILLMDPDTEELTPGCSKQRSGEEGEIAISSSIINEVVKEKSAVLSADAQADSRFDNAQSVIREGIRSTMCVPLLHGDEMLGVMHLDSRIASNAFSQKDLDIFNTIASQAALAIQNARMAREIEQDARKRAQFSRLLSPALVDQVMDGSLSVEKGGELREVAILFSDIRGFTSMSEAYPAQEIVSALNEHYEIMVEVLFRFGGTLDKYMGDGLMALFGAPLALDDSAVSSVLCALRMREALVAFNEERKAQNKPALEIGIGVDVGEVVTGMIGSTHTIQYTAIGDPVNTASRLCDVAKPGQIVLSQRAMDRVSEHVEAETLGLVKVKGKHDELLVFNVLRSVEGGFSGEVTDPFGKKASS